MKKSISIGLIVILAIAIISVLVFRDKSGHLGGSNSTEVTPIDKPWKSSERAGKGQRVQQTANGKSVPNVHPALTMDPQELSDEEIAEFEEYFEEVEKNWATQIETLFVGEFSLGEDAMEKYMNIRDAYEEEKMIAFQEFHEQMVAKYGENYSYRPTADMESFENKVEGIYLEKMEHFLGKENFLRYQEIKREFNQRLQTEQDPNRGVIFIEI